MTKHGYIFTDTGAEALAMFGTPGVRYAAALDGGDSALSGIVAFDGEAPIGSLSAGLVYELDVQAAGGDPTFPTKPAPKRHVSNGHERFALMREERFVNLSLDPAASFHITGAVELEPDLFLIETDGWVPIAEWTATVLVARDVRLAIV